MIRTFAVAGLALLAAACASSRSNEFSGDPSAVTPTEGFTAKIAPGEDQILLAPHREGLSARQMAAIDELAARWRDAGGGPITVERPEGGKGDERTVEAVMSRLAMHGVYADEIRVASYPAGGRPGDPIAVGFTRDIAQTPACGRDWKSFTRSANNDVNSNFGCAVTANIAAMVDNPQDMVSPRPMDPADAQRRDVILGKYRSGDTTSSTKDEKASGAVSNAVQ